MKAYVLGYLVLDVIQDCNLHCDMCLRGESTGKRITRDVVEKIFDSIKYVKTIVFSGGEVTLAYNEIKMILEVIKEKRVVVENYQIVVNGTIYNKKLFDLLREEFKIGNISISCDYYHDKSILEKYGDKLDIIMKNYSQIMKEEHFVGLYHLPPVLLNSGRAKNLDVTKEELVTIGFASMVYKDRLLVGPEISIDVDGNLVNGSNSYEITNDNCLGNIFETDLIELIKDKSIRTKFLYNEFLGFINRLENNFFLCKNDNVYYIRDKNIVKGKRKILNIEKFKEDKTKRLIHKYQDGEKLKYEHL